MVSQYYIYQMECKYILFNSSCIVKLESRPENLQSSEYDKI